MLIKHQPKKGAKIVVAMSGGVDSSVTAAWLKTMGYEVIGVSLQLSDLSASIKDKFGTCCSMTDISDARRVAHLMGFPFYVANMENDFTEHIVDDFIKEYLNGRTPNPCIRCNEKVKFKKLLDWALDLGADFLATGHYANIMFNDDTGQFELRRAADTAKDQTYFLFTMKQNELRNTLFPMGEYSKSAVRTLAQKLNLPVANKEESQEICFVQERNYKDFIEQSVDPRLLKPGRIIDTMGTIRGKHTGVHQFTIGQRKGLGIDSTEPLFVIHILKDSSDVVVGPEKDLFRNKCTVLDLNWIVPPNLDRRSDFTAKIRYRAQECPVTVTPLLDNRLEVVFQQPQRAITPGQALVFYREEVCFGGGWIEEIPQN